MTHAEFLDRFEAHLDELQGMDIVRISTPTARLSAGWVARILAVLPDSLEYLRCRSPEAVGEYERVVREREAHS